MNPHRKFHPELQACELEDRLVPVISNLGTIVLTTGGYVLLNPFPGASSTPGSSSSGTAIPTSFSMTGSGGISSVQPGNSTGIPGLAATATAGATGGTDGSSGGTAGSSGGGGATINVGSGGNNATAAVSIPVVNRNTIANDAVNPVPQTVRPSGDGSPVLPAGQVYRGGVPQTVPTPPSSETPGGQPNRSPGQNPVDYSSPNPLGAAPAHPTPDFSGDSIKALTDRDRMS
jgi:hypothetical protein